MVSMMLVGLVTSCHFGGVPCNCCHHLSPTNHFLDLSPGSCTFIALKRGHNLCIIFLQFVRTMQIDFGGIQFQWASFFFLKGPGELCKSCWALHLRQHPESIAFSPIANLNYAVSRILNFNKFKLLNSRSRSYILDP